jgi:hypothetical protein
VEDIKVRIVHDTTTVALFLGPDKTFFLSSKVFALLDDEPELR